MATVGYARVSTTDQSLDIQKEALQSAGCEKIFSEQVSGTSKKGRVKLKECLNYLREGDTLIITRVDRLARSMHDLQTIIHQLRQADINLKATEQPIDTSTPAGKAFFDMLGVFSEFETNLRKERQLEGIAKAKKEGKFKGRQPTAKAKTDQVMRLLEQGIHKKEIAEKLNIGIASIYRIIKDNSPDLSKETPLKNTIVGKHKKQILKYADDNGVKNVRVFGSFSRNQQNPSSDVDLLVDLKSGRTGLDLGGFLTDVSELLGRKVDVVTEKSLHPTIRKQVLSESITL